MHSSSLVLGNIYCKFVNIDDEELSLNIIKVLLHVAEKIQNVPQGNDYQDQLMKVCLENKQALLDRVLQSLIMQKDT